MQQTNGCEFSKPAHEGESWCRLANAFCKDLNGSCPKEMDVEEIKQNCYYYLLVAGEGRCRASSHEHDRYGYCWIESVDDLLNDPDFTFR